MSERNRDYIDCAVAAVRRWHAWQDPRVPTSTAVTLADEV